MGRVGAGGRVGGAGGWRRAGSCVGRSWGHPGYGAADLCRGGVTVPLNTPAFLWAYGRRVLPKTDAVGSVLFGMLAGTRTSGLEQTARPLRRAACVT